MRTPTVSFPTKARLYDNKNIIIIEKIVHSLLGEKVISLHFLCMKLFMYTNGRF